jgi:adenylate cyclase
LQRLDKTFFGLVLASLLTMAAVLLSPARDMEHGIGLELLYALRGTRQPPQEVVIITLDSRSARALGQSERPERWPRHLHARLVNGLTDRGARVIGFDVLFERAREPDGDQALAAALHRAGNVVLMEGLSREAVTHPDGEIIAHVDHLTRPLPLLQDAAWASGPFIMPKTPEGVFEFWGFIPSIGDHPSLPMLMAQLMTAGTPAAISPSPDIRLHALNLYGPLGSIRTLSYVEALDRVADPVSGDAAFRGKAVLIGFSEFNQSRQGDIFRTPYSTPDGLDISGVELCATALSNLLDGSALLRPQGAPPARRPARLERPPRWPVALCRHVPGPGPQRRPQPGLDRPCRVELCLATGVAAGDPARPDRPRRRHRLRPAQPRPGRPPAPARP